MLVVERDIAATKLLIKRPVYHIYLNAEVIVSKQTRNLGFVFFVLIIIFIQP